MKKEDFLEPPQQDIMDPAPIRHQIPDFSYNKYYLQRKYLNNLPSDIVKLIGENINWPLFNQMGYKKLI